MFEAGGKLITGETFRANVRELKHTSSQPSIGATFTAASLEKLPSRTPWAAGLNITTCRQWMTSWIDSKKLMTANFPPY